MASGLGWVGRLVEEVVAVARKTRTKIRKSRTSGREIRSRAKAPEVVPDRIFWPDRIDHVKAIAMRGMTDDEMAAVMGVTPDLLQSWKAYYPTLAKAIDEGRTIADANVVQALYHNCVGFDYETDEVVRSRRGAEVVTVKKHVPGETQAQKYWLQNRKTDWNGAQKMHVSTPKGEAVRVESKNDVINSILNMIRPQPDEQPA